MCLGSDMKLVLQSGVCAAVTGFCGISGFSFFAGTFPLSWMRRSVRGYSYCVQFQDIGNRKFQDIGKGLCQHIGKTFW